MDITPSSSRVHLRLKLAFDIDANGIIDVKALDKGTGKNIILK